MNFDLSQRIYPNHTLTMLRQIVQHHRQAETKQRHLHLEKQRRRKTLRGTWTSQSFQQDLQDLEPQILRQPGFLSIQSVLNDNFKLIVPFFIEVLQSLKAENKNTESKYYYHLIFKYRQGTPDNLIITDEVIDDYFVYEANSLKEFAVLSAILNVLLNQNAFDHLFDAFTLYDLNTYISQRVSVIDVGTFTDQVESIARLDDGWDGWYSEQNYEKVSKEKLSKHRGTYVIITLDKVMRLLNDPEVLEQIGTEGAILQYIETH